MKRKGFTLIELLAVTAIIAILLSLAVFTTTGSLGSASLGTTSQALAGDLAQARQQAVTRNRTVEVRFYSWDGGIRAYQIYSHEDDGSVAGLDGLQRFENGVIMSEDPTMTQLGSASSPVGTLPEGLPASAQLRSFRYKVDGSTDLSASGKWFGTLHLENRPGTPPDNFATIQIEPFTGAVRTIRP